MHSAEELRQADLCRRILTYWLEHPSAKDSVDGIRMWWLAGGTGVTAADLKRVLEALVAKGWACVRDLREQDRVYAFNRGETESVARFLHHNREDGGPGE